MWAGTERPTPGSTFLRDFSQVPSAATPTIVLASFISNVMAMVLPFVILIVYDRVLPNATDHTLMISAVGVAVAVLIDVAVRIGRGYIVALRHGHRAFMGSVTKILFADPKDFQTTSTARRLEQLGAIDTIWKAGPAPTPASRRLSVLRPVRRRGFPDRQLPVLAGLYRDPGADPAQRPRGAAARRSSSGYGTAQTNFLLEIPWYQTIKSYSRSA